MKMDCAFVKFLSNFLIIERNENQNRKTNFTGDPDLQVNKGTFGKM